jgi:hypothetical protein
MNAIIARMIVSVAFGNNWISAPAMQLSHTGSALLLAKQDWRVESSRKQMGGVGCGLGDNVGG